MHNIPEKPRPHLSHVRIHKLCISPYSLIEEDELLLVVCNTRCFTSWDRAPASDWVERTVVPRVSPEVPHKRNIPSAPPPIRYHKSHFFTHIACSPVPAINKISWLHYIVKRINNNLQTYNVMIPAAQLFSSQQPPHPTVQHN